MIVFIQLDNNFFRRWKILSKRTKSIPILYFLDVRAVQPSARSLPPRPVCGRTHSWQKFDGKVGTDSDGLWTRSGISTVWWARKFVLIDLNIFWLCLEGNLILWQTSRQKKQKCLTKIQTIKVKRGIGGEIFLAIIK